MHGIMLYSMQRLQEGQMMDTETTEVAGLDIDAVRRELLAGATALTKLKDYLEMGAIGMPAMPAQAFAPLISQWLSEIEETGTYLGRVYAVYAHRQLGISLAQLAHGVTPSQIRRRIISAEENGLDRPERFLAYRDHDVDPEYPDATTQYEALCEKAGIPPWPSTPPLPTEMFRQIHAMDADELMQYVEDQQDGEV